MGGETGLDLREQHPGLPPPASVGNALHPADPVSLVDGWFGGLDL